MRNKKTRNIIIVICAFFVICISYKFIYLKLEYNISSEKKKTEDLNNINTNEDFEVNLELDEVLSRTQSVIAYRVFSEDERRTVITSGEDILKIKTIIANALETVNEYNCLPDYAYDLMDKDSKLLKTVNLYCDIDIIQYKDNDVYNYYKISKSDTSFLEGLVNN